MRLPETPDVLPSMQRGNAMVNPDRQAPHLWGVGFMAITPWSRLAVPPQRLREAQRLRAAVRQTPPCPLRWTETEPAEPPAADSCLREKHDDRQADADGGTNVAVPAKPPPVEEKDADHALNQVVRERHPTHGREDVQGAAPFRALKQQDDAADVAQGHGRDANAVEQIQPDIRYPRLGDERLCGETLHHAQNAVTHHAEGQAPREATPEERTAGACLVGAGKKKDPGACGPEPQEKFPEARGARH
jgi:hypothetical protein